MVREARLLVEREQVAGAACALAQARAVVCEGVGGGDEIVLPLRDRRAHAAREARRAARRGLRVVTASGERHEHRGGEEDASHACGVHVGKLMWSTSSRCTMRPLVMRSSRQGRATSMPTMRM